MKPTNSKSAAWHREQARMRRRSAADRSANAMVAAREARIATHHDAAAKALEALAVPGVAKALRLHAESLADVGDAQVAAALETLVKIGGDR